jgi:hypothetical protein
MAEDLTDFFCADTNNWNYTECINKPGVDPYNNQNIDLLSYNLNKYNAVIMLKDILKHTRQYLIDDVIEWMFKNAFQGSKNDY